MVKHYYGTIERNGADYDDESMPMTEDPLTHPPEQARVASLSSKRNVAILAFMFVASLLVIGHYRAPREPEEFSSSLDVLGRIHLPPGDIPHPFSQQVDHLDESNGETWQQRYYKKTEFFKGPGHPIFLVVGGEGTLENGMFYPFVDTHMAEKFGALVLHVEHRFYGESQPLDPLLVTTDDLKKFHTARQSMLDHIDVVRYFQKKMGCSLHKSSKKYCPVISVGGSYPGFLSAVMRLHYPDVIDIGYASSAPLALYAMEADQFGYMDLVTNVTDKASPGCAEAVRQTLKDVDDAIRASSNDPQSDNYFRKFAYKNLNMCPGTVPAYINSTDLLSKETMMIVEYTFGVWNMFYYPPSEDRNLVRICKHVFQNPNMTSFEKISEFWYHLENNADEDMACFDMSSQMPDGPRSSISGSDWSGVGLGYDGYMFDFHCCSTLTPAVGFSAESMFPYRKWTLEWLTEHCLSRFDVTPQPKKLVNEFKFDDLVGQGASRILFTNGMNDLWSQGSYLESLSDSILTINIEDGAHHSELGHFDDATDTTKKAQRKIYKILNGWLNDIYDEMKD